MKPLFYREGEGCGSRPVRRATYFVRKGGMWAPYSEKDADRLEVQDWNSCHTKCATGAVMAAHDLPGSVETLLDVAGYDHM